METVIKYFFNTVKHNGMSNIKFTLLNIAVTYEDYSVGGRLMKYENGTLVEWWGQGNIKFWDNNDWQNLSHCNFFHH